MLSNTSALASMLAFAPELASAAWTFLNPGILVFNGTLFVALSLHRASIDFLFSTSLHHCLRHHRRVVLRCHALHWGSRPCPDASMTHTRPCPPLPIHRINAVCMAPLDDMFRVLPPIVAVPQPLQLDALMDAFAKGRVPHSHKFNIGKCVDGMDGCAVSCWQLGCASVRVGDRSARPAVHHLHCSPRRLCLYVTAIGLSTLVFPIAHS